LKRRGSREESAREGGLNWPCLGWRSCGGWRRGRRQRAEGGETLGPTRRVRGEPGGEGGRDGGLGVVSETTGGAVAVAKVRYWQARTRRPSAD